MATDTGMTHRAASAIRQSKTNSPTEISTVEISEPKIPGIKWEQTFSSTSQSAMMVLVRSARSRLPKKDSGSFRSRSARVSRRMPLSL